ncbi:TetR/AcrR family transcriptional regulator [Streptomyces sp. SHP 1-2]|uniref:TetR/AcrR family transcriptional regulator n=1 Tax=Streptomyces sp. SHP 1-2 TaxID=2769489 RepID=UPI002238CF7E|nr:TetR/AcrR family transcriptional regulator C-terminal domain-containing protein [Streptomyces sp. SHP 1-2]MCW5250114.1 TetR/AcrR family transcriptional regulator C-terminal domain-containing protein [Streptomyces sp. SHP 1-2]
MARADREGPRSGGTGDGTRGSGRGAGRPAGLDRERITAAAVRLLDAVGPAGFSMRRLAAELDVTAMSVYWYVDTKDDLLALALDAVHGEPRLPADDGDTEGDWRDQLRLLARENRAMLVRHPWLPGLIGAHPAPGPHARAFSRAVRRVVRRAGLPERGVSGATTAVLRFVHGYGAFEGRVRAPDIEADPATDHPADVGATPGACLRGAPVATSVRDRGTGNGPGDGAGDGAGADCPDGTDVSDGTDADRLDRDFEYALDLLIAGIEALADPA